MKNLSIAFFTLGAVGVGVALSLIFPAVSDIELQTPIMGKIITISGLSGLTSLIIGGVFISLSKIISNQKTIMIHLGLIEE